MKKTINGKEYTSFEDYKNATQLGIDKSRKFIVLRAGGNFNAGDIVTLQRDDNTTNPFFKRVSDGKINCKYWDGLAYYDEPKKFKVGDKVMVTKKPSMWSSYLCQNDPTDDKYPKKFTIDAIADRDDYVAMSGGGFGWALDVLEKEGCIELVEESQKSAWMIIDEASQMDWSKIKCSVGIDVAGEGSDRMAYSYFWRDQPRIHWLSHNKLTKPTGIKKYMTNIVEFAKNLTLSEDEKVLREVGLKNSEGNWTYEAISIIKNLEAKELGFDDYVKMAKSIFRGYSTAGIESGSIAFSAFELAKTFKKHEPRLLEIAREMKANEDKAKI